MNEENKVSYYAIIPATVRYDKELKPAEKLIYSEITALANKFGYCFAQNRYFADLYGVSIETVSRWLSHLQKQGYIQIEIKKNIKKEIIARYIYILDIPYQQKNQYPYCLKNQEGIDKKVKDNNIKYNKDDLFILIINNDSKISNEFYSILKRLELLYSQEMLFLLKEDKLEMLKTIIYVLYDLYNSEFYYILYRISRETLLTLYSLSKEHMPIDFINYYKKSIINKYLIDSS